MTLSERRNEYVAVCDQFVSRRRGAVSREAPPPFHREGQRRLWAPVIPRVKSFMLRKRLVGCLLIVSTANCFHHQQAKLNKCPQTSVIDFTSLSYCLVVNDAGFDVSS